jgi:hypothetical protein
MFLMIFGISIVV